MLLALLVRVFHRQLVLDLVDLDLLGSLHELPSVAFDGRSDHLDDVVRDFDLRARELQDKLCTEKQLSHVIDYKMVSFWTYFHELFLHLLLGAGLDECIETLLLERVFAAFEDLLAALLGEQLKGARLVLVFFVSVDFL